MSELDKIRRMRLEQTAQEKEQAIDKLFAKFDTAPPQSAKPLPQNIPQKSGTEIYSVFGAGSILINGVDTPLPYLVTNPLELNRLRTEYPLDSPTSPLRTRKV